MPTEILVREADRRDANSIAVLLTQLGYPQNEVFVIRRLEEISSQKLARVFVAEDHGNVMGFLSFNAEPAFHREGNIGTITAMCVLESERGRGIGHRLIQHAEAFAIRSNCVRIAVASGIQRTDTHTFYRKCGYEEKTRRFVRDFQS